MIDMISSDHNINCGMHLDTANFSTCQILLVINMMNMVIFNQRKDTTQMTDNSCLPAIMNVTAANNM